MFIGHYAVAFAAKKAAPKVSLGTLFLAVQFLDLIWIINMLSPPPPNEAAVAYSALLLWLIVPWGYWIDKHRRSEVGCWVRQDCSEVHRYTDAGLKAR